MSLQTSANAGFTAKGRPPFHLTTFRKALIDELSRRKSPGSFAYWAEDLPDINPGLTAHDLGPIALPLHEAEAQRVIKFATKAPFGKGTETIVDENVRKTWEIDGSKLTLENPKWSRWMENLILEVKKGLGLTNENIHAELYKLLIYGQGAHFKPHRDTEKMPGMFGTLIICLPSSHQGGDLCVTQGESEKVFSTSPHSAFGLSCAAWYSDVLHEVKPVTSGHRVVLTYNLVLSDSSFQPSSDTRLNNGMLSRLLSQYAAAVASDKSLPTELLYPFEHKYTEASLTVDRLKRFDRAVLDRLQASAKDSCEIYLGVLERHIEGGYDDHGFYGNDSHYGGSSEEEDDESDDDDSSDKLEAGGSESNENNESEDDSLAGSRDARPAHKILDIGSDVTELKRVVSLDGTVIVKGLPASHASFIKNLYKHRRPDEEDYEGWTGNEGANAQHWYRDTVIVLIPKKLTRTFKLGPRFENQSMLPAILNPLLKRVNDGESAAREELEHICELCLRKEAQKMEEMIRSPYRYMDSELMNKSTERLLVQACAATQSPDLFCLVIARFNSQTPIDRFSLLGRDFQVPDSERARCLLSLRESARMLDSPAKRYNVLDSFKSGFYATHSDQDDSVSAYVTDSMEIVVEKSATTSSDVSPDVELSHEDGIALIAVWSKYNRSDLESKILHKIRESASVTGPAIGLLSKLLEAYHDDQILDQSKFMKIFLPLYDSCVKNLDLQAAVRHVLVSHGSSMSYGTYRHDYHQDSTRESLKSNRDFARQTANLYWRCLQTDGVSETRLLDALATNFTSEWDKENFDIFTAPFLQRLLEHFGESHLRNDGSDGRHQQFFQRVVGHYLQTYVGQKPQPPRDWSRKKVKCTCSDCQLLNAFLVKGAQNVGRFSMAQSRRKHLASELRTTGQRHHENTETGKPPHTLVVTKTTKEHDDKVDAWTRRVQNAEEMLKSVGRDGLRAMLGEQCFKGKKIDVANSPLLCSSSAVRNPLASTDANAQGAKRELDDGQAVSPTAKRQHVDTIDLT